MTSTPLQSAPQFYNWINNRTIAPPAAAAAAAMDEDSSSDSEGEDEPPTLMPPQRRMQQRRMQQRPAPTPTSYGLLLVHEGGKSDLQTLSLLQHAVTPWISAYPHIKFSHISTSVTGFEKVRRFGGGGVVC